MQFYDTNLPFLIFLFLWQIIEKQAKQARAEAKEAQKLAKAAKAEACKTRFGGKFLCIRPFGIGY